LIVSIFAPNAGTFFKHSVGCC